MLVRGGRLGDGYCLGVVVCGDGRCLGVVVWGNGRCLGVVVGGEGCCFGLVVWGDGCCLGVVVWGDGCCLGAVVWGDSRYWCFLCTYLLEFPSPFLSSSTTKGWKCAGHRGNNRYINTFLPYVSNANSWRDGRISYKQTEQTLSCTMETRLTKEQKTRAPPFTCLRSKIIEFCQFFAWLTKVCKFSLFQYQEQRKDRLTMTVK